MSLMSQSHAFNTPRRIWLLSMPQWSEPINIATSFAYNSDASPLQPYKYITDYEDDGSNPDRWVGLVGVAVVACYLWFRYHHQIMIVFRPYSKVLLAVACFIFNHLWSLTNELWMRTRDLASLWTSLHAWAAVCLLMLALALLTPIVDLVFRTYATILKLCHATFRYYMVFAAFFCLVPSLRLLLRMLAKTVNIIGYLFLTTGASIGIVAWKFFKSITLLGRFKDWCVNRTSLVNLSGLCIDLGLAQWMSSLVQFLDLSRFSLAPIYSPASTLAPDLTPTLPSVLINLSDSNDIYPPPLVPDNQPTLTQPLEAEETSGTMNTGQSTRQDALFRRIGKPPVLKELSPAQARIISYSILPMPPPAYSPVTRTYFHPPRFQGKAKIPLRSALSRFSSVTKTSEDIPLSCQPTSPPSYTIPFPHETKSYYEPPSITETISSLPRSSSSSSSSSPTLPNVFSRSPSPSTEASCSPSPVRGGNPHASLLYEISSGQPLCPAKQAIADCLKKRKLLERKAKRVIPVPRELFKSNPNPLFQHTAQSKTFGPAVAKIGDGSKKTTRGSRSSKLDWYRQSTREKLRRAARGCTQPNANSAKVKMPVLRCLRDFKIYFSARRHGGPQTWVETLIGTLNGEELAGCLEAGILTKEDVRNYRDQGKAKVAEGTEGMEGVVTSGNEEVNMEGVLMNGEEEMESVVYDEEMPDQEDSEHDSGWPGWLSALIS